MCDSKKASHPGSRAGVFFGGPTSRIAGPPKTRAPPRGAAQRLAASVGAYTLMMLWVKSLHIVFVASWFAGLFYLPRIFVNLALVPAGSQAERDRLLVMATKLLRFSTILAVPALAFGLWLWLGYGITGGWLHAKLVVVLATIAYHATCAAMLRRMREAGAVRGHRWYRWFNEIPVVLLLAAVVLAVVKPF
jgi:protoporphyrinogen IX oxidase